MSKKNGLIGIYLKDGDKLPKWVINLDFCDGDFHIPVVICSDLENKNEICDVCELKNNLLLKIGKLHEASEVSVKEIILNPNHYKHFDGYSTSFSCNDCDDENCEFKTKTLYLKHPEIHLINNKKMLVYHTIIFE